MKNFTLVALGALLLTACSNGTVAPPAADAPGFLLDGPITFNGAILDYNAARDGSTLYTKSTDATPVYTTSINADGTFSSTLPVPTTGITIISAYGGCPTGDTQITNTVVVTPPDAQFQRLQSSVKADFSTTLRILNGHPFTATGRIVYSFQDATITGTLVCKESDGSTFVRPYNLKFQKGWNEFVDEISGTNTELTNAYTSEKFTRAFNYYVN